MSDKMTLLVVKRSQHVVGAATLIAAGDQVIGPAGILVRFPKRVTGTTTIEKEQFEVPADELEALTVDLDPTVLLVPRDYGVLEKVPAKLALAAPALALESNEAIITVTPAVPKEAKVWMQISGDRLASPRVLQGVILKDGTVCRIPIESLSQGDYLTVVLVEGHSILTKSETI